MVSVDASVCTCACHRADAPYVDEDDLLRFRGRWVALGPIEANVSRLLVERFDRFVSRGDLEHAGWSDGDVRTNTVDRLLHRFRQHLPALGLELVTVRARGFVLRTRHPDA